MNLIDFHVISTAVIVGLGIVFCVSLCAAVLIAIGHYFGGNNDEEI